MGLNINVTGGLIVLGFAFMAIAFLIEKQLRQPNEYATLFYIGMAAVGIGVVFKLKGLSDKG